MKSIGIPVVKSVAGFGILSKELNYSEDRKLIDCESNLGDLRSARNDADYEMSHSRIENQNEANKWKSISEKAIDILENGFSEEEKIQLAQNISSEWEKREKRPISSLNLY